MKVIEHCSMLGRNTFGMNVKADCLAEYSTVEELRTLIAVSPRPFLAIGGGSNLLFLHDYAGTVLHSCINTISEVGYDGTDVLVEVGSGIVWDDFVEWCVNHGLWGVENLTAIPGEVGASAIQNVGAYGVESGDRIELVHTISADTGEARVFRKEECQYGYRQSIFKGELKGRYVVTHVTFRLSTVENPVLGYGTLKQEVEKLGGPTLSNIRKAVRCIRDSKLPDPQVLGNAGSFFMNPVVDESVYEELIHRFPNAPSYKAEGGKVKIPAGWLIEQCGWKGRSLGNAAVYEKQALVLVNKGGATGEEVKHLADTVINDVREKFGIELKAEVNYI